MITLIIGGSGSGKSAYAEDCVAGLSQGCRKYYLATMQVFDQEGQAKVERHRKLRRGKGFLTVEQPVAIQDALDKIVTDEAMSTEACKAVGQVSAGNSELSEQMPVVCEWIGQVPVAAEGQTEQAALGERTALLECMSNLVANEMFSGETPQSADAVTERVMAGIEQLYKGLKHLVIVTNNVFEDGIFYDEATAEYIEALGRINESLASMADTVVEVVVGIPLLIKKGEDQVRQI